MDHKDYQLKYYRENRVKILAEKKAKYANSDVKKARARAYYQKNKEAKIAYQKAWNMDKRKSSYSHEKYMANREAIIAKVLAYAKRCPEVFAANSMKRVTAKKLRTPRWLNNDHLSQIKTFYKKAAELTAKGVPHHVDHIVPLQGKNVSGLHVPWNLQVLTQTENCRKRNKLIA